MQHASSITRVGFCASIFLIAVLVYVTSADASDSAIRAPVSCGGLPSCNEDITVADAARSYAKHSDSACLQGSTPWERPECTSTVTATDTDICDQPKVMGYYYFWAPVDRFRNGYAALARLLDRARTGRPFSGGRAYMSFGFGGYQVVEVTTSTALEKRLALCSVSVVQGQSGPPHDCTTVAIVTPTQTWLRGGFQTRSCMVSASYRPSGAINIAFDVQPALDMLEVSNALLKMLKDQLGLSAEQTVDRYNGDVQSVAIRSSAGVRSSRVLPPGWRDSLDFDLRVAPNYGKYGGISIFGTAHVMVCRQNLPNLTDYQGLNDAQRTTYASALNADVVTALKSVCPRLQRRDDKTIICN